ncbi:MAG: hypothetical protein NTU44_16375 [Bacteroidetes bacterium]|nr:hypothetical protein [Bacteroidota bacterium]
MAYTKGRILISKNPTEVIDLAEKVFTKHKADGEKSQLNALNDQDWSKIGPTIVTARAKHIEAETLKGQMEAAYRERDLLLGPISDILKSSRNMLKAVNAKNPKRLTEWGFNVDDTTAPKTTKATKA